MIQGGTGQIPRRIYDVIVAGAGPAGSIAALHLARAGHDVLLLDRAEFPREKVCGDGLIADAIAALRRAGLYEEVHAQSFECTRAVLYSPSRVDIPVEAQALVLKRERFDDILANAAARAGAVFARADVQNVEHGNGGPASVHVRGGETLRARIVLLATGAHVELLKKLDMVQRGEPSAIALRCYVKSSRRVDDLILSFDRSIIPGYAWIFPLPGGEYNIGCGVFYRNGKPSDVNLRETFDTFVREFPLAREVMAASSSVTPLKGAMLRCGLTGAAMYKAPDVLAIGETVGATYPFSGEGIGKAMETAEIAAALAGQALRANDLGVLRGFPVEVTKLAPRYASYNVAQKWVGHAWLHDFLARRARRSPYMMDVLQGIFAETADPRAIFSLRGLWKSL